MAVGPRQRARILSLLALLANPRRRPVTNHADDRTAAIVDHLRGRSLSEVADYCSQVLAWDGVDRIRDRT